MHVRVHITCRRCVVTARLARLRRPRTTRRCRVSCQVRCGHRCSLRCPDVVTSGCPGCAVRSLALGITLSGISGPVSCELVGAQSRCRLMTLCRADAGTGDLSVVVKARDARQEVRMEKLRDTLEWIVISMSRDHESGNAIREPRLVTRGERVDEDRHGTAWVESTYRNRAPQ